MLLKTLILGLGNPILGDDGVGWRIVEALRDQTPTHSASDRTPQAARRPVEFDCAALSGLSLMERLIGYDRVLLIDSLNVPEYPIGEVVQSDIQMITNRLSSRLASAHDTTLTTALEIGRQLGAPLPDEISIIGINTTACFDFSETLSNEVASAVPKAVQLATEWLIQTSTRMETSIPGIQAD